MSLRDALANVLHDSGCGCSEGPDEYTYAEADAILASDVIAKVKADALREAAKWVDDLAVHDGLMFKEFDDGEIAEKCIPDALRDRADKIERGAS